MKPCFRKTELGRTEIRDRTRKLSRTARNLLVILDEQQPGSNWVQLVQGATEADLSQLIEAGMIVFTHNSTVGTAPARVPTLQAAIEQLSYDQLYGLMTSQARDRLGLTQGFMFILMVEKCADIVELRALALTFMRQIKEKQGEAVVKQMCQALAGLATG